jgi:hypothetical protein
MIYLREQDSASEIPEKGRLTMIDTPFNFPAQFAFLAAMAMSTLALVYIANRLRDRRDSLRGSAQPQSQLSLRRARWGIHKLDFLTLLQLILTFALVARIALSAFCPVSIWYDRALLVFALINFGPLWLWIFTRLIYVKVK